VARAPLRLDVWLGSELIQKPVWFVQYDGFLRHNTGYGTVETVGQMAGSPCSAPCSAGFQEGDRVGLLLDMDKGTMDIYLNGKVCSILGILSIYANTH